MTRTIIETFNLSKIYKLKKTKKEMVALNDVNISIKKGEIFGLLGPNGAGKTTLIQILTTLRQPTRGSVTIDGYDIIKKPKKARAKIALMLESSMLYRRITAYDNLKFFCKIYNVPDYKKKINKIIEKFELEKWLNQYVAKFSSGMKMKLALCRTLLLDRPILVLDEPTLGLDLKSVEFVINVLKGLNKTIFMTSHDMNVVEKLCHRIAFINKGKILKIGTKDDIKKLEHSKIEIEVKINENNISLKRELEQQNFVDGLIETDHGFILNLKNREFFQDLILILGKYKILFLKENELSLRDLFLQLI